MVVEGAPTVVVQNRLRGTLGNPVRLLTGIRASGITVNPPIVSRYTVDSGSDASLVGHNTWQLMRFITESHYIQDPDTLAIPLPRSGIYTLNMTVLVDVLDENRIFALLLGDEPDSPAVGGAFNTAMATVLGVASMSTTIVVEEPTLLRVWSMALSPMTVLNAGDLTYPVLEVIDYY